MQADAIADQAEQIAEQQKNAAADRAAEMAEAVHDAADELGKQMPPAAEYVHAAASRLDQGIGVLRERNIRELMDTFSDIGRKEPWALFGGAVVAGFAISRFLKSSAPNSR
jgi:hypothetical protein